jgi:two-component system sensor histidine kinase YesM
VENAVIHGLEAKRGLLKVTLNAYRDDKDIRFEVIDNGVGFLRKIDADELFQRTNGEKKAGIGLVNTHKRLRLIYGDTYGVSIDNDYSDGARVVITIPFEKGGN